MVLLYLTLEEQSMTDQDPSKEFDRQEPTPKVKLEKAKAKFREVFLDDDTSFRVLSTALKKDSATPVDDLPCFGIDPTLIRNEDGTSDIGLRISYSSSKPSGVISATVAVFEYFPLAQIDRTTGQAKMTDLLQHALANAGRTDEDALGVIQNWQAAARAMGQEFDGELVIDPSSHTFELPTDLEEENYSVE